MLLSDGGRSEFGLLGAELTPAGALALVGVPPTFYGAGGAVLLVDVLAGHRCLGRVNLAFRCEAAMGRAPGELKTVRVEAAQ